MDLTKYNQAQKESIQEINNNLQITACAGSGKTRTVVARNMNILINGLAKPNEIVSITFTKKAAAELKQRIYTEFETEFESTEGLAEMYVGTIHSFCLNALQETSLKYKNFSILEDVQRTLFVRKKMSNSDMISIEYRSKTIPTKITTPFEKYRSNDVRRILPACDFIREEQIDISNLDNPLVNFYKKYIELLEENNFFDYAQVQHRFLELLDESTKLQEYIKSIKYITIDEYQDTNNIQESILSKIFELNPAINICVVGDDDQTIYAWRGSDINNFIEFENRYPNVVKKNLSVNYRSSDGIVKLGEHIANKNKQHVSKEFHSYETYKYEPGDIVVSPDIDSIETENEQIIAAIKKLKGSEVVRKDGTIDIIDYSDMAILVHSTNKLKEFNQKLLNRLEEENIEFIVDGTRQLFEQHEIKRMYDLFLYFANEYLNLNKDFDYLLDDHEDFVSNHGIKEYFQNVYNKINPIYYENTIQQFYLNLMSHLNSFETDNEKVLYNLAVFSDIINDFETINFNDKYEYRFKEFVKFLYYDAKDIYPEGWLSPKFEDNKCLKIITIHSAKGLEFPVVFMPHLCKNYLFPTKAAGGYSLEGLFKDTVSEAYNIYRERYLETEDALTRLFYVALTRSKKYLFMTKALEYKKKETSKRIDKVRPKQLEWALASQYVQYSFDTILNRDLVYSDTSDEQISQLVFDFSTLKDIFECPRKFQYSSIFGFYSPLNIRMGYGKSLHNMMEDLYSTHMDEGIIKNLPDLISDNLYLPLAPKTGQYYKDVTTSATKILTEYIDTYGPTLGNAQYIEKPIDYKLNDLVFINGRVDLITNSVSGEVSIIDFKSDSGTLSPELRAKQLLIYALGYYKLTGKYPTSVISYDLKTNMSHPKSVTPSEVDAIESEINQAYSMIKSNTFPRCTKSTYCDSCQFKDLCLK